jgi:hypothetical protein
VERRQKTGDVNVTNVTCYKIFKISKLQRKGDVYEKIFFSRMCLYEVFYEDLNPRENIYLRIDRLQNKLRTKTAVLLKQRCIFATTK